ncbi:DUF4494 domain-containing protein [bacterium]|nr:DUF4494 domain-containing protein [bacterium]
MEYWQIKTQNEFENERGKIQKTTELYLVDATSATEATAKMYKHNDGMSNFRVVEVKKTKILEVI